MALDHQKKMIDVSRLPMVPSKHIVSEEVFGGPCVLQGFTIRTNGSDDLEAELYDDAAWKGGLWIPGSNNSGGLMHPQNPIRIVTSLDLVISGTIGGGWITVYYNPYDPSL